jgi:hypothetical protein
MSYLNSTQWTQGAMSQMYIIYFSAPIHINELGQVVKYDIILNKNSWGPNRLARCVWPLTENLYNNLTSMKKYLKCTQLLHLQLATHPYKLNLCKAQNNNLDKFLQS